MAIHYFAFLSRNNDDFSTRKGPFLQQLEYLKNNRGGANNIYCAYTLDNKDKAIGMKEVVHNLYPEANFVLLEVTGSAVSFPDMLSYLSQKVLSEITNSMQFGDVLYLSLAGGTVQMKYAVLHEYLMHQHNWNVILLESQRPNTPYLGEKGCKAEKYDSAFIESHAGEEFFSKEHSIIWDVDKSESRLRFALKTSKTLLERNDFLASGNLLATIFRNEGDEPYLYAANFLKYSSSPWNKNMASSFETEMSKLCKIHPCFPEASSFLPVIIQAYAQEACYCYDKKLDSFGLLLTPLLIEAMSDAGSVIAELDARLLSLVYKREGVSNVDFDSLCTAVACAFGRNNVEEGIDNMRLFLSFSSKDRGNKDNKVGGQTLLLNCLKVANMKGSSAVGLYISPMLPLIYSLNDFYKNRNDDTHGFEEELKNFDNSPKPSDLDMDKAMSELGELLTLVYFPGCKEKNVFTKITKIEDAKKMLLDEIQRRLAR